VDSEGIGAISTGPNRRIQDYSFLPVSGKGRSSGRAGGFRLISSLRRAATSQEFAIQVGTPSLGSTHFITMKYTSRNPTRITHSGMIEPLRGTPPQNRAAKVTIA